MARMTDERASATAAVGVIGGSGFYRFLDNVRETTVETPYGPPSSPLAVGSLQGREVAFLARHGPNHELPPHQINYRANLWALRYAGVRRLLAPCSVGSLQPRLRPGDFVVCDQLVDRTRGRTDTFFDGPVVNSISFAEPYCAELRAVIASAGTTEGITVHDAGTVVVIQGPRFSTRAESRWFTSEGWDVVNMTQYPEAALARELGVCYATVALVTDYDVGLDGVDGIEPVTMERVFAVLADNVDRLRALLERAIPAIPVARSCACPPPADLATLA
jgi:5'-methylthioadenosine phosphorylase